MSAEVRPTKDANRFHHRRIVGYVEEGVCQFFGKIGY
jgi:hypothetical protein